MNKGEPDLLLNLVQGKYREALEAGVVCSVLSFQRCDSVAVYFGGILPQTQNV